MNNLKEPGKKLILLPGIQMEQCDNLKFSNENTMHSGNNLKSPGDIQKFSTNNTVHSVNNLKGKDVRASFPREILEGPGDITRSLCNNVSYLGDITKVLLALLVCPQSRFHQSLLHSSQSKTWRRPETLNLFLVDKYFDFMLFI